MLKYILMFKEPVVYVDIETTGGSRTSRIIEIAVIRVEDNEITEEFRTLINPGAPIPYHITRLTGISDSDVQDAPFFNDIAEQLHSILMGAIFIAHSVRFDYSFIKRQLEICNIRYNPKMLCSVRLSRALYPEVKGHSLQAIINRHGIDVSERHRAYDDAMAVRTFLNIAFEKHGEAKFESAVLKQLKHRSAPPNLQPGAFDHIPNTPGVYTFLDKLGIPIYIGKSITLRKRILSHFAQDTAIDKEMKLSLNTHSISFIETANELEALLLESKMVKEKLPIYNRKLRRLKKMYVLKPVETEGGYRGVQLDYIEAESLRPGQQIYGVYSSKAKARNSIDVLQKTFDLCPKLLGLEKSNRSCFKYQLGKCLGACIAKEPIDSYNSRFENAFGQSKIEKWPYRNPVAILHKDAGPEQKALVLDNWSVIGEISQEYGCDTVFHPWKSGFDMDAYKIIRAYLSQKSSKLQLVPISYAELNTGSL